MREREREIENRGVIVDKFKEYEEYEEEVEDEKEEIVEQELDHNVRESFLTMRLWGRS